MEPRQLKPVTQYPYTPPTLNPVLTPKRRLAKDVLQLLRVNRAELISDKGGVEITSEPKSNTGRVMFNVELAGRVRVVKFHIVNGGPSCVHLTFYTALHEIRCYTLVDVRRVSRVCPLLLCPATMYFEFCPESDSLNPSIVRELEAVVRTRLALELGPESPYRPRQSGQNRSEDRVVVEGVPPGSCVANTL